MITRSRLFKRWTALSTGYKSIQWITQLVSQVLIRWIVTYPVDSAIQRLNNRDLMEKALIYKQILLTNSLGKCMENSLEDWYLNIGA